MGVKQTTQGETARFAAFLTFAVRDPDRVGTWIGISLPMPGQGVFFVRCRSDLSANLRWAASA